MENEYSLFKCNIAIQNKAGGNGTGNVIIKADDKEKYKSEDISKQTKSFYVEDIPINGCSLLTIEFATDDNIRCIISEAIVYN